MTNKCKRKKNGSKYEDYIHANTNYDRFHVIHEIVNYYFDRNEEFTQYRYAIIEFALKTAIVKKKFGKAYGTSKCILNIFFGERMILKGKTGFMEMVHNDASKDDEMEKSGENGTNISSDELILELDENTRNKFISLDKETQRIIKNNTFDKSTEDKSIKDKLIGNINKFYAEYNLNENLSDEENSFGNFTGNNPNIIIMNLDNKDE